MRQRFWRALAVYAYRKAGYSPPLRMYRVSGPTLTTSTGSNVTVRWTQT